MSNLDDAKCPKCFEEVKWVCIEGDFYQEDGIWVCDNCKSSYVGFEERFRDLNQHLD